MAPTYTGGKALASDERTYKVTESSVGVTGGVYRATTMSVAAHKAGKKQFRMGTTSNVATFVLQETTRSRGKLRAKPMKYKVTRSKGGRTEMTINGKVIPLSGWTYKVERMSEKKGGDGGEVDPMAGTSFDAGMGTNNFGVL